MRRPKIPHRIPPLEWRRPAFVWTPLALAIAIGWPALALQYDGALAQAALLAGAAAFALGLVTLGVSWMIGRPPRTRRAVILHLLFAAAIVLIASPFLLTEVLSAVRDDASPALPMSMSLSMAPLALLLGLPIMLVSAIVFSAFALSKPSKQDLQDDEVFRRRDVQPFV